MAFVHAAEYVDEENWRGLAIVAVLLQLGQLHSSPRSILAPHSRHVRSPTDASKTARCCPISVTVPTVERRRYRRFPGVMETDTPSPVTDFTGASGPSWVPCLSYMERVSRNLRLASASSTLCTKLDFPEPDTPVTTVRAAFVKLIVTFFKLLARASWIRRWTDRVDFR